MTNTFHQRRTFSIFQWKCKHPWLSLRSQCHIESNFTFFLLKNVQIRKRFLTLRWSKNPMHSFISRSALNLRNEWSLCLQLNSKLLRWLSIRLLLRWYPLSSYWVGVSLIISWLSGYSISWLIYFLLWLFYFCLYGAHLIPTLYRESSWAKDT